MTEIPGGTDVLWHIDRPTANAYLRCTTDAVTSASVEAHLESCATCQALLASAADDGTRVQLVDVWERVDAVLDRPRVTATERVVRAVGGSDATVGIVTASAQSRWSFLTAVAVTAVMAVSAAQSGRDAVFGMFLVLAPLGPLIATAGAFGRWADPVRPLLRSMPLSPWRVAFTRTVASVVPAIALTACTVPLLDERGWLAIGWLLPSLALSVAVLALATWIAIEPATLVVAAAWLSAPALIRLRSAEFLEVVAGPVQVAAILVVACGGLIVAVRRAAFEIRVLP